ncbi:hypothetical protein BN133_3114 [Cronobacter dublinensis 582]|nr:hypothetical protein BN133_3114 [Cronobacter dublinensis 582]
MIPVHPGGKQAQLRTLEEFADVARFQRWREGQLIEVAADRVTGVIAFRAQVHVLVAAFILQFEILVNLLNHAQVSGRPLVAVAFHVAILTALGQHRWRDMPAAAKRGHAIARETPGVRLRQQRAVGADRFHFRAKTVAIQQRGFRRPVAQAVEAVVMQADQRMHAIFRRVFLHAVAVDIHAVFVIFGAHPAHHQLHRPNIVIEGQHIILRGVFAILDIAERAAIQREVAARVVAPAHVINPRAGPRQEHDVGVYPVDIEVITIEAFTGPDGGIFECAGKGRQMTQFSKRLTHVEIAGVGGPVVIAALSVGHHHFEARGGAVSQRLFVLQVHFQIGVRLVAKTSHVAAGFASRREGRTALGFGGGVAH